jgi:nitroimidazol reductase NimA-like FMN-containing flavoprotein (pyridoxamine 5'-phosphate oxidase superfamily)
MDEQERKTIRKNVKQVRGQGVTVERKMRRMDRSIPESEAKDILQKGEYGILSTVSPDGEPYGVPLNYSYAGDAIYFHCAREGHKLENLSTNSRVSFCVVGKTEVTPHKFGTKYESVMVFGEAYEVTDGEKREGLTALANKYFAGFLEASMEYIKKEEDKTRVYKIAIESMAGKARR